MSSTWIVANMTAVDRLTGSPGIRVHPNHPRGWGAIQGLPQPYASRACSTNSVNPAAVFASAVPLADSSANLTRCATVQWVESITPRMPRCL